MATALVVSAFIYGVLSISLINYRTIIVGSEGTNPFNQNPGSAQAEQVAKQVLVQTSVTVLENTPRSRRLVRGVPINVSVEVPNPEDLGESEAAIFGEPTATGELLVQIAYGVTNRTGTVSFWLSPGNYTVFARHLGVLGNVSISLVESKPTVSLRWVFHYEFQTPDVLEMNDANMDGWISSGENMAVFYQGVNLGKPQKVNMTIVGERRTSVDLAIQGFSAFPHGTYIQLSPLQPLYIGDLKSDSTLQIGTTWYEVSRIT